MPGPTNWPQTFSVVNTGTQAITTTTETVVATLNNVNSRGAGFGISLTGLVVCAVDAGTTVTTFRIRANSLTGSIVTGGTSAMGGIATDLTSIVAEVAGNDTTAVEFAGKTYVLTVQSTGAASNWNVTFARLNASS